MEKSNILVVCILALLFSFSGINAFAFDANQVPAKKRTTLGLYLSAKEAYELAQQQKVLFVDVRTRAEVNYLGMPALVDANIPYMILDVMYTWDNEKNEFGLEPNSGFTTAIGQRLQDKGMTKDDVVILICRSGDRSAKAADLLAKAGYTKVYSVVDGYEGDKAKDGVNVGKRTVNGWKNSGLPWSYDLDKNKMYLE